MSSQSKVFILVSMSLDGYLAPEGMDLAHGDDPGYKDWASQWSKLQAWVFPQAFIRKNLFFADGGETGPDNDLLSQTFARTGVSIMGKRMFEGGERYWPEEAPFHTPVFVLTQQVREPWERPGGTTFYFVNDGLESALRKAREAAGDRDIRLAGGANLIQQYLNAGLVDEMHIALSPVFLGAGVRLFDGIDRRRVGLELVDTVHSPRVSHLSYRVTQLA